MSDELLSQEERERRLKALDSLQEFSEIFTEAMKQIEEESEAYWNSLTKEQQLDAFCAVARRIYEGEIKKKGSYRYVLYEVFGFGFEAYAAAQDAGYLSIHNAIYTGENLEEELIDFAEHLGVEDAKGKFQEYAKKKHWA